MFARILKRALLALVVLGVAAAALWALWPKPVPVDVAAIERGVLEVTVEDEGVTRIREIYTVSAPVAGTVLRTPRKVGDSIVAQETLLAIIEPSAPGFLDIRTRLASEAAVDAAVAAVDLAQAQVQQAGAQLEFAEGDLRRANQLAMRQAISERALEQARFDVATARNAVTTAEATLEVRRQELARAKAQLVQPGEGATKTEACCIEVRAPVHGRVLKVTTESETVVQAGTPLVEVGDPADLEIAVDLLSRDAVRIEPGAPARIEGWGGGGTLNARVRQVEPVAFTKVSALGIEEQRVRAILDLIDPPQAWSRLGHGFRVVARIVVWRGEDVVLVPLGALFRHGENWAVFVVEEGRAALREIAIGERTTRAAQVVSGLLPGEVVVLHPSDRVAGGSRVERRSSVAGR